MIAFADCCVHGVPFSRDCMQCFYEAGACRNCTAKDAKIARLREAIRKIGEKLKGAKDWETVEAIAREIALEGR